MNYYPHHIGDFDRATRHLTRIERSIYRDLIELYYDNEQPLTLDMAVLCRKIIARSNEEVTAVEQTLNEFFSKTDGGWYHVRCEEEIGAYRSNSTQKSAAGKASAAKRAAQKQQALNGRSTSVATSVEHLSDERAANQEPVTNNHKPATISPPIPADVEKKAAAPNEAAASQATGVSESSDGAQGSLLPAELNAAVKATATKSMQSDADFEAAWGFYPKRDGGSNKQSALKAWRARIATGKDAAEMIAGVMRYAKYCDAKGNTGSQYVKRAETFFGPDLHFELEWAITPQTTAPARAEKFDPLAYVSQTQANANNPTERSNEQHGDYIDVQFNEVDR